MVIINTVFTTAMISDYFTEDELIKKTGIMKSSWDLVILKELIDNALDALEPIEKKHVYISNILSGDKDVLQVFDSGT